MGNRGIPLWALLVWAGAVSFVATLLMWCHP